jgi:hypothetical protein
VYEKLPFINVRCSNPFKSDVFVRKKLGFGSGVQGTFSFNLKLKLILEYDAKLLKQAVSNDILILNQQTVTSFVDKGNVEKSFLVLGKEIFFNGFANTLGSCKTGQSTSAITSPLKILISRDFSFDRGLLF